MKKCPLSVFLFVFLSLVSLGAGQSALSVAEGAVGQRFLVTDFGAVGDGKTLSTAAIQQAIDTAQAAGGGTVVLPEGRFLSGSIFLKQGVGLHLEKGAVLLGSQRLEDYPKRNTRIEGHFEPWRMALVNAQHMDRLRITGEGMLDGNGEPFWAAFWERRRENPKCTNLEVERPRLMFIDQCNDVFIAGIRLKDSGFWNLHIYRSLDVTVEGLVISAPNGVPPERAPSSDGIDIDSCQRVTIRDCRISVGDDCIAIKGSKGPHALEDKSSPPVEKVLVENCVFESGHGVVTLGSEATVVRDVTVRNCRVTGENRLIRLKLRPDTPQTYENLLYENIEFVGQGAIFDIRPWTQFFDLQGEEPPPSVVRNVTLRNIVGATERWGVIARNPRDTFRDITIEKVDLELDDETLSLGPVENLRIKDTRVNGKRFGTD